MWLLRNMWDSAFTFSLGRIGNISSSFNNDKNLQPLAQGTGHVRDYRYYETEVYGQDSWHVRHDLTLTYGLRWQYYSVPFEVNGGRGSSQPWFRQLHRSPPGRRTGKAVWLLCRTLLTRWVEKPITVRRSTTRTGKDLSPRFSFAYNPSAKGGALGHLLGDGKTVIRGGAGLIFDHTATSALNFLQDQNTYILQGVGATTFPLNPGRQCQTNADRRSALCGNRESASAESFPYGDGSLHSRSQRHC